MQQLTTYILRGRFQAITVIAAFASLAWIFPPFFIISCAALGLVVLRQEKKFVTQVLAGSVLICALISFLILGTPLLAITTLTVLWLPVIILARVLRATQSQTIVLIVVIVMGLLFALVMRSLVGDTDAFWQEALRLRLNSDLLIQNSIQPEQIIQSLVPIMTSLVGMVFGLLLISSILLARWWQSQAFNPNGFAQEFRKIQLPLLITAPILISLLLFVTATVKQGFILDIAIIGSSLLMFHGLAVVHSFAKDRQLAKGWLIGLYFFLMFTSVYVVSFLAMIAIADSFSDYRKLRTKQT